MLQIKTVKLADRFLNIYQTDYGNRWVSLLQLAELTGSPYQWATAVHLDESYKQFHRHYGAALNLPHLEPSIACLTLPNGLGSFLVADAKELGRYLAICYYGFRDQKAHEIVTYASLLPGGFFGLMDQSFANP